MTLMLRLRLHSVALFSAVLVLGWSAPANSSSSTNCPASFLLTEAIDYDQDIQPIFDANCVGCHQPGTATYEEVGLNLRPGESYWNLMGRRSFQADRWLAHPWSANTLIIEKLLCSQPSVGARMPKGLPRLSDDDLSKVFSWQWLGGTPGLQTQRAVQTQPGLAGSWFDPATSGQGMVVELIPRETFPRALVYWFTFSEQNEAGVTSQRWYLADGFLSAFEAGGLMSVYTATGGAFDRPEPQAEADLVGTAVIKFLSCTEATFAYHLYPEEDGQAARTGEIHLQRLSPFENCED